MICIALGTLGGVGLLMTAVGISPMEVVAPLFGRQADLTGRTDLIWDVLLPIAQQNPLLGLGFGSFWIRSVPGLTLDVNEAHNGYLDVYLELGIAGLILIGLLVITYFRKAKNELEYDFNWGAFRLSYLAMFLLHNWTETTLLRSTELLWCIFIILLVVYPAQRGPLDSPGDPPADEANWDLEAEAAPSPTAHAMTLRSV
jgi:exopolysaccharide production protein ExoQ